MKVRITIGHAVLTAILFENKTAEDLAKLCPLELRMDDLFYREKYGNLPAQLTVESGLQHTFTVGDIAYWPPCSDIVIYYNNDLVPVPSPGIIIVGRVLSGLNRLRPGSEMKVKIEKII